MRIPLSIPLAALVLSVLPCSFAQQPTGLLGAETLVRRGRFDGQQPFDPAASRRGVAEVGGALWGYGRSYRAGFETGAVEFTPMFGEAAPRNLPLRLQLESMRRGTTPFLEADAAVAPKRVGDRVEYLREQLQGGGVRERYECRNEGMELSFVFDRKVTGDGDLVVRMRLDSELRASAGERLGGLEFEAAPFGGVTIGGVTGIDADGRECTGWLNHGEDWLEMVLPAAFVDTAAWPVVLDPLLGVYLVGHTLNDMEPCLAYDPSQDKYQLVYTVAVSATDSDVLGYQISGQYGGRQSGIQVFAAGSGIQRRAAVANVAIDAVFGVTWQTNVYGGWSIEAIGVRADTGATGNPAAIGGSPVGEVELVAAGEATLLDDDILIAWQRVGSGRIEACQFTPRTGSAFGFTEYLGLPNLRGLAVSHHVNARGHLLFAYEIYTDGDYRIQTQVVDRDLFPRGGPSVILGQGHALRGVDCDAIGNDFYLVYERREQPGDAGFLDVHGARLTLANGSYALAAGSPHPLATRPLLGDSQPAVAWLGDEKVVVAWTRQVVLGFLDSKIALANFHPSSGRICGPVTELGFANPPRATAPTLVSKASSGAASDEAAFLFEETQQTTIGNFRFVQGFFWAGMGPGGPVFDVADGCGLSGRAGSDGPFALGNEDFAFTLTGANGGAPSLAACSFSFAGSPSLFFCGSGCALMAADFTEGLFLDASGNGRVRLPLPCDPRALGVGINAQFVVSTPSVVSCGIAPVSVSNVLRAIVGE